MVSVPAARRRRSPPSWPALEQARPAIQQAGLDQVMKPLFNPAILPSPTGTKTDRRISPPPPPQLAALPGFPDLEGRGLLAPGAEVVAVLRQNQPSSSEARRASSVACRPPSTSEPGPYTSIWAILAGGRARRQDHPGTPGRQPCRPGQPGVARGGSDHHLSADLPGPGQHQSWPILEQAVGLRPSSFTQSRSSPGARAGPAHATAWRPARKGCPGHGRPRAAGE
jgi:hypothetical protein